ncbi:MAG: hypothetical protein JTJ21_13790 [Holdemanella sp.]|nr:hypothetical protein [Holdemanella sp.]
MANYCYNDITICAKEENLTDLEFLHSNLWYLLEYDCNCHSVFNKLLESYEKEEVPFDGRDRVEWFMDEINCNGNDTYNFIISIESAWYPIISKIEDIVYKLYDGKLWCVGTAEEPGFDIYINTDETGEFYETRYRLVLYKDNNYHDWYLDDIPDLINHVNKIYDENNYGEIMDTSLDAYEVSESVTKFNNSELAKSKELEIAIYTFEDSASYE